MKRTSLERRPRVWYETTADHPGASIMPPRPQQGTGAATTLAHPYDGTASQTLFERSLWWLSSRGRVRVPAMFKTKPLGAFRVAPSYGSKGELRMFEQTNPKDPNPTYCTRCDSAGACEHDGALRYLDPITYNRTEYGWSVPETERARFDDDRWRSDRNTPVRIAGPEPMMLRDVFSLLERICYVDERMNTMLNDCYDVNAAQTSLMVLDVARNAPQLASPGGLLVSRMQRMLTTHYNGSH